MSGLLGAATLALVTFSHVGEVDLEPRVVAESCPEATVEGPAAPDAGLVSDSSGGEASQLQLRPRRESDAYVETAVSAGAAVVTSADGGEQDLLAPQTIADLAIRAGAAGMTTATNVALVRSGAQRTVDMAAVWVPREGAGVVMTMRF